MFPFAPTHINVEMSRITATWLILSLSIFLRAADYIPICIINMGTLSEIGIAMALILGRTLRSTYYTSRMVTFWMLNLVM